MTINNLLEKLIWANYFRLKSNYSRYIYYCYIQSKFEVFILPIMLGNYDA